MLHDFVNLKTTANLKKFVPFLKCQVGGVHEAFWETKLNELLIFIDDERKKG